MKRTLRTVLAFAMLAAGTFAVAGPAPVAQAVPSTPTLVTAGNATNSASSYDLGTHTFTSGHLYLAFIFLTEAGGAVEEPTIVGTNTTWSPIDEFFPVGTVGLFTYRFAPTTTVSNVNLDTGTFTTNHDGIVYQIVDVASGWNDEGVNGAGAIRQAADTTETGSVSSITTTFPDAPLPESIVVAAAGQNVNSGLEPGTGATELSGSDQTHVTPNRASHVLYDVTAPGTTFSSELANGTAAAARMLSLEVLAADTGGLAPQIKITLAGEGTGVVTSSGETPQSPNFGISCPPDCKGNFPAGSSPVLTATADTGSDFNTYSGTCSTNNPCTIGELNEDRNITATFDEEVGTEPPKIIIQLAGTGTGVVTSSAGVAPNGSINCPSDCVGSFTSGSSPTLTATPDSGSEFTTFSGSCGTDNPCTIGSILTTRNITTTFDDDGGTGGEFVVDGVGDICPKQEDPGLRCQETANAIIADNPDFVLTFGDLAYPDGDAEDFAGNYQQYWGQQAIYSKTLPTPGNHEWNSGNSEGYRDFYDGGLPKIGAVPQTGSLHYSWSHNDWDFIALDTDSIFDDLGDCSNPGASCVGTPECIGNCVDYGPPEEGEGVDFAVAALEGGSNCEIVYGHHPRYASGSHDNPDMDFLWEALANNGADLYLVGHEHHYEDFEEMNAAGADDSTGLRQIITGTGGAGLRESSDIEVDPQSSTLLDESNDEHGFLRLTLDDNSYEWEFVASDNGAVLDSGSDTCS